MSKCLYENPTSFIRDAEIRCTIANQCLLTGEHTISSGDDCWNVLGGTLNVGNGFKGSIKSAVQPKLTCSVNIASGVDLDVLVNGGCTVEAEKGVSINENLLNVAGSMTGHGFHLKNNAQNNFMSTAGNLNVQFLPGSKIEKLTVTSGSAVVAVEEVKNVFLTAGKLTLKTEQVENVRAVTGVMIVDTEKINKAQSVGAAKITVNTNDSNFESSSLLPNSITK
eukprot:Pgem_evm1s17953